MSDNESESTHESVGETPAQTTTQGKQLEYITPTRTRSSGTVTEGQINSQASSRYAQLGADIVKACLEVTTSYRVGKRTKSAALLALQAAIPRADLDEGTYNFTLSRYSRILDDIESQRTRAAAQPQTGPSGQAEQSASAAQRAGERAVHASEPADTEATPRSSEKQRRPDSPLSASLNVAPRPRKRRRSVTPESDDDEPARARIDLKSLPWVIQDDVNPARLPESLRKTIALLENISRDPRQAKSTLINSTRCPQFPDSEWTNILAGRAVDLDRVLASLYTVSYDERRTERFGNLELAFGPTKPAKTVDTHGKWVIAWGRAVEATRYVFPHRSSELHEYGEHLNDLFAAFPESSHARIIAYDRAVRIRVAQRRDLLLTEYHKYADLHILWIQGTGAGATQDRPRQTFKRRDPCRRWNDGKCPNSSTSCTYGHVCSKCRSNAHVAADCQTPRK
jgi:hypothetical protein